MHTADRQTQGCPGIAPPGPSEAWEAIVTVAEPVWPTRAGLFVAERSARALNHDQLTEVLRLIRADSVELRLSVPESDRRSALAALETDPLDAEIRQVVFFDTPDLEVSDHGVTVRVRHVWGKPADSVVTLRPIDPEHLPAELRKSRGFGVEVDAMPGGFVCSAAMKAEVDTLTVKETLAGRWPVRKLFTREQCALFKAYAPGGISLESLERLGPINVLRLKFTPREVGRRRVAELWNYPDGSRILELSTKCPPADAFQVAAETKAFLAGRGIDLSAMQWTKTKTAMQMFAAELQAQAAAGRR
jgi:hypothetical protein